MLANLKSGALVPVLSDFLPAQFSIDALYPHREHLPAKVRAFIDVVAKNFREIDWDPCSRDSKHRIKRDDGIHLSNNRDPSPAEAQNGSRRLRGTHGERADT